jgi:uncharacterized protein YigA (DUF484 family)
MSSRQAKDAREAAVETGPSDEQVAAFLSANPDFFDRHAAVLDSMVVHHASGRAVSLIEKQVERLRDRNQTLQGRLKALLDTARENESRVLHLQDLARALIVARSLADVFTALDTRLKRDFSVDAVFLGLKSDHARTSSTPGLRYLPQDDEVLAAFGDCFRQGRPLCGPVQERQLTLLFPEGRACSSRPRSCRSASRSRSGCWCWPAASPSASAPTSARCSWN